MRYALILLSVISIATCFSACDKKEDSDGPGRITFWTNNLNGHGGWMNVTVNGQSKQITLDWPALPDCTNTQGTASFELSPETHSYTVTDANGQVFFGNVLVYSDDCTGKQLD